MGSTDAPDGPLTPEAERGLVRRLISGDEEAVRILYGRFGGPVYGLGLRLLGSPEAAQELTQDTFLAVWRKAPQYDPARGRLSTWIMVIAHNLGVDRLRREARRPVALVEDVETLGGEDVETEARILDRVATLELLSVLSAAERRLLGLAYYRGWTAREISLHDSIPLGTVKTRLRSALIKLRRAHGWKREL
ncbi:MAG TPA: sigma-70 family RNA polymerase sigma factor [Actinomycetota bacterium]